MFFKIINSDRTHSLRTTDVTATIILYHSTINMIQNSIETIHLTSNRNHLFEQIIHAKIRYMLSSIVKLSIFICVCACRCVRVCVCARVCRCVCVCGVYVRIGMCTCAISRCRQNRFTIKFSKTIAVYLPYIDKSTL